MKRIYCHTNLDLSNEVWPTELPEIPKVGDKIESATKHGDFRLSLEVVAVRWVYTPRGWHPAVELHNKIAPMDFYMWYAPLVGKNVSNFM